MWSRRRARAVLGRGWRLLRAVVREARAERLTFMAGSIAYHAFVSLVPFLLVVLLLVSRVDDPATARGVLAAMGRYLSPNAGGLLTQTVTQASERTSLSALGLLVLVWGAIKIFRSLDEAFSAIYDTEVSKPLVDSVRDALVALLAVGLGIFVAGAVGAVVSFGSDPVGTWLDRGVTAASLTLVFLPLFYIFPDTDVTVREVLPGTVFAALGWMLLEAAFRYYVAVAGLGERYGVVGTIVLLITWLYFSGFVVLLGASINAVLGGRSTDAAELGWGRDEDAKRRSAFARQVEALSDALAAGDDLVVETGETTVRLPAPDDHESDVAAPDRPNALGEAVTGSLAFEWEREGEEVREGDELSPGDESPAGGSDRRTGPRERED